MNRRLYRTPDGKLSRSYQGPTTEAGRARLAQWSASWRMEYARQVDRARALGNSEAAYRWGERLARFNRLSDEAKARIMAGEHLDAIVGRRRAWPV